MLLLAFHVIAIGILVALVWAVAYAAGRRAGERTARRSLAAEEADPAGANAPQNS